MIHLLTEKKGPKISKYIYGQFAEHLGRCIYEGIYVGEDATIPHKNGMRTDVVEALKALHIPVLRWPGGCFADEYHWKDGIGEKNERKMIVNTNWGGQTETNAFGTHEFFELVEQLECEAYINGNVGSGTVQEMSEWVEYMTMDGQSPMADWRRKNGQDKAWRVKFFGVGNENWGCGGNMRPEYYADLYNRYQTFVRQYGEQKIYKIAGGANADDYHWTEKVMQISGQFMDGISLHFYVHPGDWTNKGSAVDFSAEEYYATLERATYMEELITRHTAIMDQYDPEKKVDLIVDEWGGWYDVAPGTNPGFLYQQNTMRDAMVAAITLNIFHQHADRIYMANIAQAVNVLQAMILTEGDQMIKTPTYHVFDLYQNHMEGHLIDSFGEAPQNTTYTASQKDGIITLTIANYDLEQTADLEFTLEAKEIIRAQGIIGESMQAYNDFEQPDLVKKSDFTSCQLQASRLTVALPPLSLVTIEMR